MPVGSTPVKDTGYSWIILAASTSLCAMFGASFSTIGVYLVEFVEYFQVDKTELGWVGACQLSLFGFAGLFVGRVVQAVGNRASTSIGAALLGIGYISSAFTDSLRLLYLTFGIIAGIGYGFLFTTAPIPVQQYFDKQRSTANGIMLAGNSIGAFFWPPLVEWLIQMFTWRGAMLIQGGLLLNGLVAAGFLRPFPAQKVTSTANHKPDGEDIQKGTSEESDLDESSKKTGNKGRRCGENCRIVDLSLFKNGSFLCYVAGVFATQLGHFGIFAFLPLRVVSLGISKQKAALLPSVLGACGGISRVCMGILGDKVANKRALLAGITAVTTGVITAGSLLSTSYWWLLCYVILYGVIGACYIALLATLVVDTVGLAHVANGMGLCVASVGLANLILYPCTGALLDATGDASYPFLVFGGCQIVGGIFFCIVQWLLSRRRKRAGHLDVKDALMEKIAQDEDGATCEARVESDPT